MKKIFFFFLFYIYNMTGAELVGIIAVCGTTLSAILTTLFHSRCSSIKLGCMECKREVMTQQELENENNRNNI